ncbi:MAG: dephospho-CoA kinase [Candidatus Amulumruptor caecigallinarius]|nr:dephospho-CoA kinase [Candidatus Amulumruptor caecigallinarius]
MKGSDGLRGCLSATAPVVAITGGIGSGKSVVSRVLRLLNHDVYDCDYAARKIMDNSDVLKCELVDKFGRECVSEAGIICRAEVARHVFGDDEKRLWLNQRVHALVEADLRRWAERNSGNKVLFFECAILRTSCFDRFCDGIWLVNAPDDVRIKRVVKRDHVSEESVLGRIRAQSMEYEMFDCPDITKFNNDGISALLPQIYSGLAAIMSHTHNPINS